MSNRVCPKCGEEYSDTYKNCPFCEEDEAIRRGKPIRRHGGKRLSKKKRSRGAGGVMLSMALVVVVFVVGIAVWGPQLMGFIGVRTDKDSDDRSNYTVDTDTIPDKTDKDADDNKEEPPVEPGNEVDAPSVPAGPLALDQKSITIPVGEKALLNADGGNGTITWTSSNENIASVSDGTVAGLAGGTVTITAVSGEEKVTCKVTITGTPWVSSANLKLNKEDMTISRKETVQMKVKDADSNTDWNAGTITWTTENANVATVDSKGVITGVGKGITNIVAKVDGHELKCIVRCK